MMWPTMHCSLPAIPPILPVECFFLYSFDVGRIFGSFKCELIIELPPPPLPLHSVRSALVIVVQPPLLHLPRRVVRVCLYVCT